MASTDSTMEGSWRMSGISIRREKGHEEFQMKIREKGPLLNHPLRQKELDQTFKRYVRKLYTNLDKTESSGWTPDTYPNPLENQAICGINQIKFEKGETSTGNDRDRLLLCDPDKVLGNIDLDCVARALRNFTKSFREGVTQHIKSNNFTKSFREKVTQHIKSNSRERDKSTPSIASSTEAGSHYSFRGNNYSHLINKKSESIEIGVAIVRKFDVSAVLRKVAVLDDSFEDENDLVSNAAHIFSNHLREKWWISQGNGTSLKSDLTQNRGINGLHQNKSTGGILIFLSEQNQVSFIVRGSELSRILPTWRLEKVENSIQNKLRSGVNYGDVIIGAINDISSLLNAGPPSAQEQVDNFISRFRVTFLFLFCLFLYANLGNIQYRRNRWYFAERASKLDIVARERASKMQVNYKQQFCVICLNEFCSSSEIKNKKELKELDIYGIPRYGSDGLPIKILRCGHIFDQSCWKHWIQCGIGDVFKCPVCRLSIESNERMYQEYQQHESNVLQSLTQSSELLINNMQSHSYYGTTSNSSAASSNFRSQMDVPQDSYQHSQNSFYEEYSNSPERSIIV